MICGSHFPSDPVHRLVADTDEFGRLANAVPGRQRRAYGADFVVGHLRPSDRLAAPGALRPRLGDASPDPLHDHGPLELGEHAEHLEHGLAGWRAGIEPLSL